MLKGKYPLPALQEKLKMAKSRYCRRTHASLTTKREDDLRAIAAVFHDNEQQYGYRRGTHTVQKGYAQKYLYQNGDRRLVQQIVSSPLHGKFECPPAAHRYSFSHTSLTS